MLGSTIEGDTVAIQRVQRSSTHYFQRPDAEHLRYEPARTSLAGLAADLRFSKMAGGHWRWGFGTHTVSPGFEVNDLGFLREADFTSQYTFLGYDQFQPGKLFRRWNLFTNQWNAWSYGGEHVSVGGNINGSWELVNFWGGWGGINREFDRLVPEALRGGPALVVPARTEMFLGVYSDSRKPVRLELEGSASFEDETGGRSLRFGPELELRLADGAEISLEPSLSSRRDPWQYIGQRSAGGETHYIFGGLRQTTASLSARASYTFSPTLSLQLYAQPFISAGRYADFREVEDPRAQRFEQRFHTYAPSELSYDAAANRYNVSRDGASYGFDNPAFNFKQFRSNLVLRWEYRPGSTLFLVWSQGRTRARDHGSFDLGRDLEDLFEAESTNVLLIKASYWLDF
ncbi:MAG: hypothetical protein HY561_02565 [Gemmatimonadetes bacterium]|nr:hypothetical protein [Gemmatimonadota bacterium]